MTEDAPTRHTTCSFHAVTPVPNAISTGCHDTAPSRAPPHHHSTHRLQSRVGRENQRYDGPTRLLACIVVSRRCRCRLGRDITDECLLISSSKHPTQWILPKGGWEQDESILESALREADEEAGMKGDIVGSLDTLDFVSPQGRPCRFYGFRLEVTEVFSDWAEQTRQRKWVSFDQARELLQHRPELVEMVSRAAALFDA